MLSQFEDYKLIIFLYFRYKFHQPIHVFFYSYGILSKNDERL